MADTHTGFTTLGWIGNEYISNTRFTSDGRGRGRHQIWMVWTLVGRRKNDDKVKKMGEIGVARNRGRGWPEKEYTEMIKEDASGVDEDTVSDREGCEVDDPTCLG